MKIYAARDKNTDKLVSDITSPRHKFWQRKGDCEAAISKYMSSYHKQYDLELVEYELVETSFHKSTCQELDEDFSTILACAVRYAIGRQTYMPKLVVDYITPLLSALSNRTLCVLQKDIEWAEDYCGYGDDKIDKPVWMKFLYDIKEELKKRSN